MVMRQIHKLFFILIFTLNTVSLFGQAKKPTIMVAPADVWCFENGFTDSYENQGRKIRVANYERAFQENSDLLNVITKISELMSDRNFPVKDMYSSIRNLNRSEAEDAMTLSNSGNTLSETPLERLLAYAKADIMVEVSWTINPIGPKKSVTYNLRGLDAYTNKQIAASQGTGAQSFSSEVPVLLEEAVLVNMDNFLAQLQNHFNDMGENGREIAFNVRVWDNGDGIYFSDEYHGEELTDIIDNWVYENTVQHRYNLSDAGETRLSFEQVRIPLYTEKGRPMDARQFASGLRKLLGSAPYNITSRIVTKGLGKVELILGEK